MKRLLNISALAVAFMFTLSSCGGNGEKAPAADQAIESPVEDAMPAPEAAPEVTPEISNVLTLEANDQMQYNKHEFRVLGGKDITLTLKHVGTMPKTAMGHNFVLLKKGTDIDAFSKKALEAKDNDYIPKSESGSIIAHTKLLNGGESDTITFKAPEKGTYDFICSFPGHSAVMKGKLIVE